MISSFEALRVACYHRLPVGPHEPRGPYDPRILTTLGSDIVSHLPVLEYYASRCKHVTEFGLRHGHSTTALLAGCRGEVHSYDIVHYPIVETFTNLRLPCKWCFHLASSIDPAVDVPETDMLFVDSEHTCEHVRTELKLHGRSALKWLVFHDTSSFGQIGSDGAAGIVPAIEEFLEQHAGEYKTVYRTDRCNGLWIVERCDG